MASVSLSLSRAVAATTLACIGLTWGAAAQATAVETVSTLTPTFTPLPTKSPAAGAFEYYFHFELVAPNTSITATYAYTPPPNPLDPPQLAPIQNFAGEVVSVSNCTGSPINDCTIGAVVGTLILGVGSLDIAALDLAAGHYAYRFTGNSGGGFAQLYGQTLADPSTAVPAPAVSGLLGIGLVGLLATRRRRS